MKKLKGKVDRTGDVVVAAVLEITVIFPSSSQSDAIRTEASRVQSSSRRASPEWKA